MTVDNDCMEMLIKEVEQKEEELIQAILNSNCDKLSKLISEKLYFTIPTGDIITKEMDISSYRNKDQIISHIDVLTSKVTMISSATVMVFKKLSLKGTFKGESIDGDYAYTRVWHFRCDSWQIVGGHCSRC